MKIVNDDYQSKVQGMFANCFSFDEASKIASFDFGTENVLENTCLEKSAGIRIDNSDEESVRESIMRYVTNELAIFPIKLGVQIDFIPLSLDKSRGNAVLDGQGAVNISYKTKVFSLPILVQNGELFPFDVIESEGQRVPFSRENLAKVISGIVKWHKDTENGNGILSDGFKGIEQPLNPTTTPGFMGDVMSIRDQHMQKRGPSNITSVASEYGLDSLLEKTAGMSELSNEEATAIAEVMNKKALERQKEYFDKLASEDAEFEKIAEEETEKLAELEELPFRDVKDCKHEDIILFSEEIRPGEFQTTKAIVFKKFKKIKEELKPMTVILSTDGRMRIMQPGEKFPCVVSPNETFKVSKKDVSSLDHDDVFIAIDGEDVFIPCAVENVDNVYRETVSWSGEYAREKTSEKYLEIKELTSSHMIEMYVNSDIKENSDSTDVSLWDKGRVRMFNLDETAFTLVGYNDFLDRKSKEMGLDIGSTQELFPKSRVCNESYKKGSKRYLPLGTNVLCADRKFRVVAITGKIGQSLDMKDKQTMSAPIMKTASVENIIRVECIDRSLKLYNVSVWYKDTEKKMFNARKQDFQRVSEGKTKAILRILKFSPQDTNSIMYNAKNGRYVEKNLPSGVTSNDFNMLQGGSMTNVSAQNVKNTVNKLINPQAIATTAATALATDLIIDTIRNRALAPGGKSAVNSIYNVLRRVASFSEDVAAEFEKIAMETKSHDMLNIAKTLVLSKEYLEKCAEVVTEHRAYPEFRKISEELIGATPLIEKVAYELVEFNRNQFKNKESIISPGLITEAINSLDTMHKMASIVTKTKPMDKVLDI